MLNKFNNKINNVKPIIFKNNFQDQKQFQNFLQNNKFNFYN